jgi:CCR4-NOT transcription complex subunit 1
MEVSTKYFRRVQSNVPHVFSAGARSADANGSGSYHILASEMQKLRTDPEQPRR